MNRSCVHPHNQPENQMNQLKSVGNAVVLLLIVKHAQMVEIGMNLIAVVKR